MEILNFFKGPHFVGQPSRWCADSSCWALAPHWWWSLGTGRPRSSLARQSSGPAEWRTEWGYWRRTARPRHSFWPKVYYSLLTVICLLCFHRRESSPRSLVRKWWGSTESCRSARTAVWLCAYQSQRRSRHLSRSRWGTCRRWTFLARRYLRPRCFRWKETLEFRELPALRSGWRSKYYYLGTKVSSGLRISSASRCSMGKWCCQSARIGTRFGPQSSGTRRCWALRVRFHRWREAGRPRFQHGLIGPGSRFLILFFFYIR